MKNSSAKPPVYRFRLRQVMENGVWAGLVINIVLIPLFWLADIHRLALFSCGSTLLYVGCLQLLKYRQVSWVVLLTFLEILVHVPFVVLTLGWDSGFQYYLLVILPLVFVVSPRRPGITTFIAFLLGAAFAWLDYYTRRNAPFMSIRPGVLDIIRYVNILAAVCLCSYVGWRHSQIALRAERYLAKAANTDPLTALSNRRHVTDLIHREVARCERTGRPLSFIIADIDHFKAVNDRYGHEVGDEAIVRVSEQLRASVRQPDLVARWGGEEFLIALPETPLADARKVAQRIRARVEAYEFDLSKASLQLSLTLGVSERRPEEILEKSIDRADQALYRGKKAGRNVVETD